MTIAESLIADVARLSIDEQRAMRVLFDRVLNLGRKTYGEWVAAHETRDMARELRDELVDGIWYAACDAVLRADGGGK